MFLFALLEELAELAGVLAFFVLIILLVDKARKG
jgi:hypothetical protein